MSDNKRHCPTCNTWLKLPDAVRDKAVRCPKCKGVLPPDSSKPSETPPEKPASSAPPRMELDDDPAPRRQAPPSRPPARSEPTKPQPKPTPRDEDDEDEDERRRRRRQEVEPEDEPAPPPRKRRRYEDEEEDPPGTVRGRRLTRDDTPAQYHDDIPRELSERARELSLTLDDIRPNLREVIEDELANGEKIAWIGQPDFKLKLLRNVGFMAIAVLGLAVALFLFILALTTTRRDGGSALWVVFFIAAVPGAIGVWQLLRFLVPDTLVYVLTTRRVIVIGWQIFKGIYPTSYGPELAACPRIRRSWLMANAGDLIMQTLIVTTYTHSRRGTGVSRSRTFFGILGINKLDEVDQLLMDTLGVYIEPNPERPKAYWDFIDVMIYAGYGVAALVVFGMCGFCMLSNLYNLVGRGGGPATGGGGGGQVQKANFRDLPWRVQADAGPAGPVEIAKAAEPFAVGDNAVFFPHAPTPFAAVGAGQSNTGQKQFQIYDLAKWQKHGRVEVTELEDNKRLAISPDGKWLASRHRGKPMTFQFRSPFAAQAVNFDLNGDAGWVIGNVEFASALRLVAMSQNGENAPDRNEMRFLVYDVEHRKQLSQGTTPRLFHPKWATFSRGGKYMAMVVPDIVNQLVFWDLDTGEPAGCIEAPEIADCYGLAFSPDGSQITMLSKRGGGNGAQLLCWNVADRSKVHEHRVSGLPQIEREALDKGGKSSLAWLPDGSGWLVFGNYVFDKQGAKLGELIPAKSKKGNPQTTIERVFRGNNEVTDMPGKPRTLTAITLPKTRP